MPDDFPEEPPFPTDADNPRPNLRVIAGENDPLVIRNLGKSFGSAVKLLRDPEIRERLIGPGKFELNEMTQGLEFNRTPIDENLQLRFRLGVETTILGQRGKGDQTKEYAVEFPPEPVRDAFRLLCSESAYHPVREYLQGLCGLSTGTAIAEVAGLLGQTGFAARLVRMWAVGCVARAFKPGCKLDHVLILASPKGGRKKSSFFKILAGDAWFSDTRMDITNKDSFVQLHENWLYEWAELAAISGRRGEEVKAFASSATDGFRAPYAVRSERHARTCVFVGTTNSMKFLDDASGDRRWWPLLVGIVDEDRLRELRDAFWAEATFAYERFEAGLAPEEQYWIDAETPEEAALAELHQSYQAVDPWDETVEEWVSKAAAPITVRRCLKEALTGAVDINLLAHHDDRMSRVLARLGYKPLPRRRHEGVKIIEWVEDAQHPATLRRHMVA